jgi:hypothetical protein
VQDHATPEQPHQYATGMTHVFVNGVQVLKDGEHTGAKPGRVVRGPGYGKKPFRYDYPEQLHPLLALGSEYNRNYTEFDLGRAFIPDLIRLATDFRLYAWEKDQPEYYASVHAWRRLGQLGAAEAAKPLTEVFLFSRVEAAYELPDVYEMIGPPAIPALKEFLEQPWHPPLSYMQAIACLRSVAIAAEPLMFSVCEAILIELLAQYKDNHPMVNSVLVLALIALQSSKATRLIIETYTAGLVAEEISGSFEDVQKLMGIRELTAEERWEMGLDDDDLPGGGATKKPGRKPGLRKKKSSKKKRR